MKIWNGPIEVNANGRKQKFMVQQLKANTRGNQKSVLYLAQLTGSGKVVVYSLDSKDQLKQSHSVEATEEFTTAWNKPIVATND